MRIITGKYKGRSLETPEAIRPTEDRVRKAFFDIMGDSKGVSFLELFAGSGAIGIEALSQGAAKVVFVEKDRQSLKSIENNLRNLGIPVIWGSGKDAGTGLQPQGNASLPRLIPADALAAIPGLAQEGALFDIIFADPPYYRGLAEKTLQKLVEYDILLNPGHVILQHFKKDAVPESCGKLILFKQAKYGDTVLSFFKAEAVK